MRPLETHTFELAGEGLSSVLTMPSAFSRCDCYGEGWCQVQGWAWPNETSLCRTGRFTKVAAKPHVSVTCFHTEEGWQSFPEVPD